MKSQAARPEKKAKKTHEMICGRFKLPLNQRTLLMGVLNRTPDSFSDGGLFLDHDKAVERVFEMVREGADIIDIGGESTRPGASKISLDEELERTIPIIKKLAGELEAPISIDTSKSEVARAALESGAAMVNDVSGLKSDPAMARVAADYNCSVVVMHSKGTPQTMQRDPVYKDLITEITKALKESINIAERAGVRREKIIIDPGIGFGKTTGHNLEIIKNLHRFEVLGKPILIGLSRKSFIGNVLNLEVDKRVMGGAAATALAIINGAGIIRVHDVARMREVARMADAIRLAG